MDICEGVQGLREEVYLLTARRAYEYLRQFFWTRNLACVLDGGHLGNPVETKKRIYGQAFTVYALAEYAAASSEKEPLKKAVALHRMIEDLSHDGDSGGYFETYERDWKLAGEQRLSEVDMDEKEIH